MARIKGITIVLVEKIKTGNDPFGKPVFQDHDVEVENVLISPMNADDIVSQLNLTGRKAVYTLAVLKGDNHDWDNKEVKFFGERWRTFGIPLEGLEDLIPLDWNKKVMVERYE